jgi:hypothetical protein
MSRDTSAAVTSANAAAQISWSILADIGVTSTTVYACTGDKYLTSGGNTYSPVGNLGGVEPVQEDADTFPRGMKMWCALVSSQSVYEAMAEHLFNRSVSMYRAVLNPASAYTVVGTPQMFFKGRINRCEVKVGDPERGNYFELELESRLRREAASAYYTRETLYQTYSGDTLFNYVHLIPGFKSVFDGKVHTLQTVAGQFGKASGASGLTSGIQNLYNRIHPNG